MTTKDQLPPPDQTPQHIAGVDHAHEMLRRMGYHHDGDWLIHVNRRGAHHREMALSWACSASKCRVVAAR